VTSPYNKRMALGMAIGEFGSDLTQERYQLGQTSGIDGERGRPQYLPAQRCSASLLKEAKEVHENTGS